MNDEQVNCPHGYIDGFMPDWKMFLKCPVSRTCTVLIMTTGQVTVKEIDRMIENLQLARTGFANHEKNALCPQAEPQAIAEIDQADETHGQAEPGR